MLASDDFDSVPSVAVGADLPVDLVIFTTDDVFLQTLREAVAGTRRLWHVPSADQVSDLLLAGQVGILVLDVNSMKEDAGPFIQRIKRQFSNLVLVVAGTREAEGSVASLISSGLVYRFIHKPMSPGRARLFAEAAIKKYEGQRRLPLPAVTAPIKPSAGRRNWRLAAGSAAAALAAALLLMWVLALRNPGSAPAAGGADASPLARAAAALAANRLIASGGDGALDLYNQALAANPNDSAAKAGLAEVRERLLSRAENALLQERLEDAAAAIQTARQAGVDAGRIALLTSRYSRSQDKLKRGAVPANREDEPQAQAAARQPDDRMGRALALAEARIKEDRLLEPADDSAKFHVGRALQLDPSSNAAQAARQTLAFALLNEARAAIDRRDFGRATTLIDGAGGIAAPANVEASRQLLAAARANADRESGDQLLRNGQQRLQQDRLVEPANDSAKYYLLALRNANPANPGLGAALQDLGQRLVANARRALELKQYESARMWLDQATQVGYTSADSATVSTELEAALSPPPAAVVQNPSEPPPAPALPSIVAANQLTLVKSVKPVYPARAELFTKEGWVELDFTVNESGAVKDIVVHASNPPDVFDGAAITALSQWRYKPVLKDAQPVAQRARIRIRFVLAT